MPSRDPSARIETILRSTPAVAYPDEPLRVIVHRMAETGLTHFPVVARGQVRRLLGMISLEDLLKARALNLDAERRRERVMTLRLGFPFALGRPFGRKPRVETPPERETYSVRPSHASPSGTGNPAAKGTGLRLAPIATTTPPFCVT